MRATILIFVICLCGCGTVTTPWAKSPPAAQPEKDDEWSSPEEKKYAQWSNDFTALLVKQDYAAAYALCSSHLRAQMTQAEFESAQQKLRKEFGTPLKIKPVFSVNTEKEELAGPNYKPPKKPNADSDLDPKVEEGIRKMVALDAVGTLPDSVPLDIRRASVRSEVVLDPATLPANVRPAGKPAPDEEYICLLTMVLVEENGQLRVAHLWQRWPNILD
ncbi:MAG TPA: hypothetical protein VEK08_07075 [Planctomycetota bacterium]|nr:hypothetical protein [Planctomycetota bacterium]